MKRLMTLMAVAMLATGCSNTHTAPHPARASAGFNQQMTVNAWAQAVRAEIESKMYGAEQYQGKICTVRLSLLHDGMVMSARSEGGDPALCQAAIAAVKVSTFPPVPKELQGQKGILLDFKP